MALMTHEDNHHRLQALHVTGETDGESQKIDAT